MQENTKKIIMLSVENDSTISDETRTLLLNVLDGKSFQNGNADDRILTRREVADRLNCSVQMVDYYARNGYICPVSITGKQSQGYLKSSIDEALEKGSRSALKWRKRISAKWTPEKRAARSKMMKTNCHK